MELRPNMSGYVVNIRHAALPFAVPKREDVSDKAFINDDVEDSDIVSKAGSADYQPEEEEELSESRNSTEEMEDEADLAKVRPLV